MELLYLEGLQADVVIGGGRAPLDGYLEQRLAHLGCPFYLEMRTLTFKQGPIDPKVAKCLKEFAIEVHGSSLSGEFNTDFDFLLPCYKIVAEEGEVIVETEEAKEDMIRFMELLYVVNCDPETLSRNMPWMPEELCLSTPVRKEKAAAEKKRKALEKRKKNKRSRSW